ncbi:uncharacterized protein Z519_09272 [Cladophialophora bantiana CBS 173.52]|uniref:Uncharacterized protein n=1 Tax=Cladophialophora bantiana (strain ATCC 10958 / CBS 173.52 / CDC B-1940 / NIH 8579) TaxID=1442370 RepID=A0A0D2H986_CLAB1|nr:uncharacterized protein Z519_09272 [Cladophialophora bantiana CBS 173.52]KIW89843.1 hypothetical protein Z519_09272 [Cladophialophora bantiana CBS 173.52]
MVRITIFIENPIVKTGQRYRHFGRLKTFWWPDAALVGSRERARGYGQAAARDWQGRRRLEGQRRLNAALVGIRKA